MFPTSKWYRSVAAQDKGQALSLPYRKLYSSRPVMCTMLITESPGRSYLYAGKNNLQAKRHPSYAVSTPPPSLPQCRQNLAEFSLTNRQFIFYLFLSSRRLNANVGQIRGDLLCLGGVCSFRIRGVPRLSFRTERAMVTLFRIREWAFQVQSIGLFRTTCRAYCASVQVENLLFENKMLERGTG